MRPLQYKPDDPLLHHAELPVRVYENDEVQGPRIARTRQAVEQAIASVGSKYPTILSLGCGTGDVEGPFAERARVVGVDCNPDAIAHARERFPREIFYEHDIETLSRRPCDVLILAETLEHLRDPAAFVKRWLPRARSVVITHPIDEPLESSCSGGDHSWAFDDYDLRQWTEMGGHSLEECFKFQMGGYLIGLARGRLLDTAP